MSAGAAVCALYPTSRAVEDLVEPFASSVRAFLYELALAGCTVEIHATRRPEQRAWLMQVAWDLDHELVTLDRVPTRPDIPIVWTLAGAREMVRVYELVHRPSLGSKHIVGKAIDMTITGWKGTKDQLYALGVSCGVQKLVSDPPHWSDDGH